MTFKIGSYTIESKQGLNALEKQKIKTDDELKKLDKNNDKKISNQELEDAQIEVDLEDDDVNTKDTEGTSDTEDSENATDSENSDSSSSDSMTEIDALKKSIESLEETLTSLLNKANTCADIDQLDSVLSSIETTQNTLSTERTSLIKLMSGGSTTGTTATATSTDGSGTNITSSAGTASAIADYALQFAGKSESEMASIITNDDSGSYAFNYGQWCCDFVSYCTKEVYGQDCFSSSCCSGSSGFGEWARSKNILMDSRETTIDLTKVKPGDYILYNASESAVWSHIGIVTAVNSDGTVDTVEGNTTGGACATHSHVSLDGRGYGVSFILAHNVYGTT